MEFIKQVLDLANQKCISRHSSSLFHLCGMDDSNEEVVKELMNKEELGPLLNRGAISFLRSMPALGWAISATMSGTANSLQTEKLIKKVYENPLLYKACSIIKEKYKDNNNADAASDELLRIIELEGIL